VKRVFIHHTPGEMDESA